MKTVGHPTARRDRIGVIANINYPGLQLKGTGINLSIGIVHRKKTGINLSIGSKNLDCRCRKVIFQLSWVGTSFAIPSPSVHIGCPGLRIILTVTLEGSPWQPCIASSGSGTFLSFHIPHIYIYIYIHTYI